MKVLRISLIIFSLLMLTLNKLKANVAHPEPRPHTLNDIQKEPVKEEISIPVQMEEKPKPELILEITTPAKPQEPEKPVKKPKNTLKPAPQKSQKQGQNNKETKTKKLDKPTEIVKEPEKINENELSNETKTYNNPVYVGIVEKSLKSITEDSLENAHANLSEVKRYWMNEAKLHPETKREIDIFQELNNSFIAYLNAMYMLDRMKDPNYYKAKAFYEYSLSKAENVLLEFEKHNAKLSISIEDYVRDIEMELSSVNDIIEPR